MSEQLESIKELDFRHIIGGPLRACVEAQKKASEATHHFLIADMLKEEEEGTGCYEPVMVSFTYTKDGLTHRLSMPLMNLVPLPYLHIEQIDLNFQATVTECAQNKLVAKYSATHEKVEGKETQDGTKQEEDSFMAKNCIDIHLHAGPSGMPAGMSMLLDMFSNQLIEFTEEEETIIEIPDEPESPPTPEGEVISDSDSESDGNSDGDGSGVGTGVGTDSGSVGLEPEAPIKRYNVQFTVKLTASEKVKGLDIINSHLPAEKQINATDFNKWVNKKAKTWTIPLEESHELVSTIVNELNAAHIECNIVKVKS